MPQPFWQELMLQATGPFVAAVVGALIAGILANSQRVQNRRARYQLRIQLIEEMMQTAWGLYYATQRYYRAKYELNLSGDALQTVRSELDNQFHKTGVSREVIESLGLL